MRLPKRKKPTTVPLLLYENLILEARGSRSNECFPKRNDLILPIDSVGLIPSRVKQQPLLLVYKQLWITRNDTFCSWLQLVTDKENPVQPNPCQIISQQTVFQIQAQLDKFSQNFLSIKISPQLTSPSSLSPWTCPNHSSPCVRTSNMPSK